MLFRFLGLAFLQYYLFSLVCASTMREYLKIAEDASSSFSSPKRHPFGFSPYPKSQGPIPGTFRCPNGQEIDEEIIGSLLLSLSRTSFSELQRSNIKVTKIVIGNTYDTFVYPINPDGSLVQQSASEEQIDSPTGYELVINQVKKPPFERHFGAMIFRLGTGRQKCPYTLLRVNPVDSSIFVGQSRKVFDCNGVFFQLYHVYIAMLTAKNVLHKGLLELQLAPTTKAREGYPTPFEPGIFTVKDTWMFPIFPGGSLYIYGDPGIYSVIIADNGDPVGVVYLKTQEQRVEEARRFLQWMESPVVHKYGVCGLKDFHDISV